MNKKIIIGIITLALLGVISIMVKNNNQQPNANIASEIAKETQTQSVKNSADKIEVYYFYRTQRCYSCVTLGQYIKETIEQKFSEETRNNIKKNRIGFAI